MDVKIYPNDNIFLKIGVHAYLEENINNNADRKKMLFILLQREVISKIITDKIIEHSTADKIIIFAKNDFLSLALYFFNLYPKKVSIMMQGVKRGITSSQYIFKFSTGKLKSRMPISPGEYFALSMSLNQKFFPPSFDHGRRKTLYSQRYSALKKLGIRKINNLIT